MSAHRLRVSIGNIKLGGIGSVSLPPLVTCAPDIPCGDDCYAVKLGKRRPNVLESWKANLRFLRDDRAGYFEAIAEHFRKHEPRFFRFHVSGDFINAGHLLETIKLARSFPTVKILAFSKRFEFFPHPRAIPASFALIASQWDGWKESPRGFRKAWIRFPDNPDPRIPSRALECPGSCEACALCWNLRKLRADVVFDKH